MFGDLPEADSVPPFLEAVPLVETDPTTEPTVCVKLAAAYIPYILGALTSLLLQKTWDTSDPDALNLQQSRVFDLLYLFQSAQACATSLSAHGQEVEEMSVLRVDCDCNVWITCCDGTEIQLATVAMLNQPGQPGGGTTQPPPGGGHQCYHAVMNANGIYYLPTTLSTGDTVQIENAEGAVSNSHTVNWHCPDGKLFFAGACVAATETNSLNPLPSENTSSLVLRIGANVYSLNHGPFTVPSGFSLSPAEIQVNDNTLTGLSGEFSFDVCVTNNQPGTWSHLFDFRTSPHSWFAELAGYAPWIPGVGFTYAIGGYDNIIIDTPVFVATNITRARMTFLDPGPWSGSQFAYILDLPTSAVLLSANPYPSTGGYQTADQSVTHLCTQLRANVTDASNVGAVIQSIELFGTGSNPFSSW